MVNLRMSIKKIAELISGTESNHTETVGAETLCTATCVFGLPVSSFTLNQKNVNKEILCPSKSCRSLTSYWSILELVRSIAT
jgi:hypothetical protein